MKFFTHAFCCLSIVVSMASCQQVLPKEADAYRMEQDFEAADSAYSAFLQKNISNKEAWSGRGIARLNLQHYTEAEADLSEAIRIGADKTYDTKADVKMFRGIDFFHRGIARYAQGNMPGAREDYTQSVFYGYNATEALVQRSLTYAQEEKYSECINDLTEALKLSPNDTLALSNRAYYRSLVGDNTRAIADYDTLIKYAPRDKSAWLNRGYTKIQSGNLNGALIDIEKALEIDADYINAVLYHGIIFYDLGRYEEAMKEFDYCNNRDPGQAKVAYYRGVCFIRLGKIEQGCEQLTFSRNNGLYDGDNEFRKYCK